MNISQGLPVVLSSLNEIPKEVLFKSELATRDQLIPNRYHFKFPSQWANQLDKDAIIGIRSMYISRTVRFVEFNVGCAFWDENPLQILGSFTVKFHMHLDADDKWYKLCTFWDQLWKDRIIDKDITVAGEELGFSFPEFVLNGSEESSKAGPNGFTIRCLYNYTDTECILSFSRQHSQETVYTWTDVNGHTHRSKFGFSFLPLNHDAEELLGSLDHWEEFYMRNHYVEQIKIPVWSRYHLYLTSSIAVDADDNFLGHTDRDFSPLKYYRITSTDKTFWIELYDTRNHHCPVVLPEDNKDVLYIEAIVCFSTQAKL